jgi:transcriptional regulator with XRE-family HTH domain
LTSPENNARWIRALRLKLGLTQDQFAKQLGVNMVTVSRWENELVKPNRLALKSLTSIAATIPDSPQNSPKASSVEEPIRVYDDGLSASLPDFHADSEIVRLFVEGERLRYGHLFSPSFGIETAMIDPVPHQIIAVYQNMLTQPRLRFLLADDAGAGKTIMTGLYIREMLNRRLIHRVLIVPPAGLVGNWLSELKKLFSLEFSEINGADCRSASSAWTR